MQILPDAFKRWQAAFLTAFPDFDGFGKDPNSSFDESERVYKIRKSQTLLKELERAKEGEISYFDAAIGGVLPAGQGSLVRPLTLNSFRMLDWKENPEFEEAVSALFSPDGASHPAAVQNFVEVFSVPLSENQVTGAAEQARQIATCLLMLAYPNAAIYSRRTILDQMYLDGVGEGFPKSESLGSQYTTELGFANAVRLALRDAGWEPRDLLDVQSFLYRTHEEIKKAADMQKSETNEASSNKALPTNLILFGPPGTGKTYETIAEAVSLCDGELPGEAGDEDFRQAIVQRYRELKERGRIEFITFHQSFSYEEFVEGLKPDTGADDGEEAGAGFRLVPVPGVFRRIAKRAIEAGRSRSPGTTLPRTKVFKMSLGVANDPSLAYLYEECIANGYVLTGYGGEVDWSDEAYSTFSAIRDRWQQVDPDATSNNPNIVQTYSLRLNMSVGDLVIVSNGNLKFRAIGRVTGPYEFVKRDDDHYYHRRSVDWLWVDDGEGLSHQDIYDKRFSQQTLYQLVDSAIKWPALEQIVIGEVSQTQGPPPYVLIIDEINRANVSKVFGELITLLEQDKRLGAPNELKVRLPYSAEEFGVPSNLNIIGTMNTADRSIALLDTALRRRFSFRELMPNPGLLSDDVDGIALSSVLGAINDKIEYLFDRDHQVGHAYFMGCQSRSDVDSVMREKIIPLLVEYFYEDWEQVRRVLGETRDVGQFVSRRALAVPAGVDDMAGGEPRWRYSVNPKFGDDAYDQIIA